MIEKIYYNHFRRFSKETKGKIVKNEILILIKLGTIIIFHIYLYGNTYINFQTTFNKKNTIKPLIEINDNIYNNKTRLTKKVSEIFYKQGFVNINDVENTINFNKYLIINNYTDEINIGVQVAPNFILPTMITLASIMDSQNLKTKIRLHIAVVLNFTVYDMLKIYSLRNKIRNDTEFNFYNASEVEKDLNGLNTKGPGAVAKHILPKLLPNDVKKILIFDTGDLLVLRDLKDVYNWDMKDNIYVGIPGPKIGQRSVITKQIYKYYINIGSYLTNVTKFKSENMYNKFVKYKNYYHSCVGDEDLLNDISIGKVGFYPLKYGHYPAFKNDKKYDKNSYILKYYYRNKTSIKRIPKNIIEYFKSGYNPIVIHQYNGKWSEGSGLTIFRRIAQYYIRYAGILEETCKKYPGYCIK